MPREQITEQRFYFPNPESPAGAVEHYRKHVHVGWSGPGAVVQLAISVNVKDLRGMLKLAEDEAADHAKLSGTVGFDPERYEILIYSDALDRREANKLIRITRTAREKAFGRDE